MTRPPTRGVGIALVLFLSAMAGCGTEDFPGSPGAGGVRDVPYVTTYNFGFHVGFDDLFGADGNLQIISGGDLLNLISAANITQAPGTGVISGQVFDSVGTVADVVLAATDVNGRRMGDFFYNGLGGTPDFVQTRGTVSTGGFTALNVAPGEVFLKAVAGGRGGARLVAFADEVSLGTVEVVPVPLPVIGVTGEVSTSLGKAITKDAPSIASEVSIEVVGQMVSEAGNCNDELPTQDQVEARQFTTLMAFRFCVASDGEYLAKLTGDARFMTTYYPFKADRAQLTAQQATDLTEFFAIQRVDQLNQAIQRGNVVLLPNTGIIAGQIRFGGGSQRSGAVIRVTDEQGAALAVANGQGTTQGTLWYLDGAGMPMLDQQATGFTGRFLIVNLPAPGTVYLTVTAEEATTGVAERYTATAVSPVFRNAVVYQPIETTLLPPIRKGEENRERYFTGPISGQVMTEDGLAPVPNARITSLGVPQSELSAPGPQAFFADGEGRYDVPVGLTPTATTPLLGSSQYMMKVDGPGYMPTYQRVTTGTTLLSDAGVFEKTVQNLAAFSTATVAGLAAAAESTWESGTGIIYGTVVDRKTGRPAEGMTVRVMPIQETGTTVVPVAYFNFAGVPLPPDALRATTTDGRFIAFNVPPGTVSVDVVSPDDTGNVLTQSMAAGVTIVRVGANNAPPERVDLVGRLTPLIGSVGSSLTLSVVGGDPLPQKKQCPAGTFERESLCYSDPKTRTDERAKVPIGCDNTALYGPYRVEQDGYCIVAYGAVPASGAFTVPVGSQNDLVLRTSGAGYFDTYTFGLKSGERGVVNASVGAVSRAAVSDFTTRAQTSRLDGTGLIWGQTVAASLGAVDSSAVVSPVTCADWSDLNGATVGCSAVGVPGDMAAGLFNADAARDLAVIDATSGTPAVTIWLNQGTGGFVLSQRIGRNSSCLVGEVDCGVETGPAALVAVDYNADGLSDLVVLNRTSRTITLLEGRGRGKFVFGGSIEIAPAGTDPNAMATADFNRDARPDLLVTDRLSGQLILLLGTGAGFRPFRPTLSPLDVGDDPRMVVSGFVDSDAIPDLVFANVSSVAVLSRIGVTGGNQIVKYTFPSSQAADLRAVAIGDLNRDGRNDVVVADASPGNPRVWVFLDGVGPTAVPIPISAGPIPRAAALIDLNGDRALDLIVVNEGDGTVLYRPGDGTGGFGIQQVLTIGGRPTVLVMDDVTGDGLVDAILADPATPQVAILPQTTRPVDGITVAAVQADGRAVGEVLYLDEAGTSVLPRAGTTGVSGRFVILNIPPGPVWLRLIGGGSGSRFLYAYPDAVTNIVFPVIEGPTSTVSINGVTVDAVLRPVGDVQIRFLGTERTTSSSALQFDERGNPSGGASYRTRIEANSDYIIKLKK